MDYQNIFAGMPAANVPNNPFASRVNEMQRFEMAQPFMNMAQKEQEIALAQKKMAADEAMSPEARAARLSGLTAKTAQNRFNEQKALHDIELLPQEQKLRIAELSTKINSENAKPYREFLTELASVADVLEKTPEQHRPMVYAQWAAQTKQKTGHELPPAFQQYSADILNNAKQLQYALVMTPQHRQQLGIKDLENKGAMDRTREQGKNALAVANVNATAAMERQRQAQEVGKVNIPQRIVQIRREMAEADPDKKAVLQNELRGYITSEVSRIAANDTIIKGASGAITMSGPMGENARKIIADREQEIARRLYTDYGLQAQVPQPPIQKPTKPIPIDNKYEIGEHYEGKTGVYEYLGGDPKQSSNFKKIR